MELEASNNKMQEDVEQVFLEKQRKENQLRQLKDQMDKVRYRNVLDYKKLWCSLCIIIEVKEFRS